MLLTKELAAKGTAMLGSAGAGGTGIYYGGHYLSGLDQTGDILVPVDEAEFNKWFFPDADKGKVYSQAELGVSQ